MPRMYPNDGSRREDSNPVYWEASFYPPIPGACVRLPSRFHKRPFRFQNLFQHRLRVHTGAFVDVSGSPWLPAGPPGLSRGPRPGSPAPPYHPGPTPYQPGEPITLGLKWGASAAYSRPIGPIGTP